MFVFQVLMLIDIFGHLTSSYPPIEMEPMTETEKSVPDYTPHPETGVYLIGDIAVDVTRNAVSDSGVWSGGVIPYVIDKKYPKEVKDNILAAMREIERDVNTPGSLDCIRFEQRIANEVNYIRVIARGSKCYSNVGCLKNGPQEVSIGKGCEAIPVIMHELVHAIGFHHEMSRPDRDTYISINWENLQPGKKYNFNIYPDASRTMNLPYDYGSLMHYDPYALAEDGDMPVLTPKRPVPDGVRVGQQLHLSKLDVLKIQRLYNCSEDSSHVKQRTKPSVDHCDFGRGFCNFTQDQHDDLDWTLQSGPSDHGHYDYAIAKANGYDGRRAVLISQPHDDRKLCLEYSYYMRGPGSVLKLYTQPPSGRRYEYFTHKSGYDDATYRHWQHKRVTINNREGLLYHLVFEAITGSVHVALEHFNLYKC